MKKNVRLVKKPALALRREHIRVLTTLDLEQVAGGRTTQISDTCPPQSKLVVDTCG